MCGTAARTKFGDAREVLADERVLALVVHVEERRARTRRRRCSPRRRRGRTPRRRLDPARAPRRRRARRAARHRACRPAGLDLGDAGRRGSPRRGRRPRPRRRTRRARRARAPIPTAAPVTIATVPSRRVASGPSVTVADATATVCSTRFDRPGRSHGVFRRRQARARHGRIDRHRRGARRSASPRPAPSSGSAPVASRSWPTCWPGSGSTRPESRMWTHRPRRPRRAGAVRGRGQPGARRPRRAREQRGDPEAPQRAWRSTPRRSRPSCASTTSRRSGSCWRSCPS